MKRYLVFAAGVYYPEGGWEDFFSAHDDFQSAKDDADKALDKFEYSHVVDLESLKVVFSLPRNDFA